MKSVLGARRRKTKVSTELSDVLHDSYALLHTVAPELVLGELALQHHGSARHCDHGHAHDPARGVVERQRRVHAVVLASRNGSVKEKDREEGKRDKDEMGYWNNTLTAFTLSK